MNHRVPDFHEIKDDCAIPTSSGFSISRPKKPATDEEEIMELMWQNGQVVLQKSANKTREIRAEEGQHLFMQEDEMASWLQYPLDDSSFARNSYGDDLFYSAPIPTVADIRPTPAHKSGISPRFQNFGHFSRLPSRPRIEPVSKPLLTTAWESMAVEAPKTPMVGPATGILHSVEDSKTRKCSRNAAAGREWASVSVATSSGDSGANFSASAEAGPAKQSEAVEDRKRKAREAEDSECQSEDMDLKAAEAKMQGRGTKKSRASQVHNLSERRRRDRINEKMKALQELIPRCNKSDKASMLDEAIEYMKSLQMQLQMMSMGYGMISMVYPGMQQYMPTMVMGMGMNMVPYPSMLPASSMQNPATTGPGFPMVPGFHPPQVPIPDHSRIQATNQTDSMLNSHINPNLQNFVDPYQHFLGPHQPQLPLPQNQARVTVKTNTSKEVGNPETKQSGRK